MKNRTIVVLWGSLAFLWLGSFGRGYAQSNGYEYWQQAQGKELHLRAPYREKIVEQSTTRKANDWTLIQQQEYNQEGRLARDVYYKDFPTPLYDLRFVYKKDHTAEGINEMDASTVTYAFTEDGLLNYYVVDKINNIHMIYNYDEKGRLISVKDCLAPFGNYHWCGYFTYTYNSDGRLERIHSYNLRSDLPIDSLELFSIDSLVYNSQQQLTESWSLDATHVSRRQTAYQYNKKGQLILESGRQLRDPAVAAHYNKIYRYHCNGKLRYKRDEYYEGEELQSTQEAYYNTRGWIIEQSTGKEGKGIKYYRIKYKRT